jgi:hypothetical protein
VGDVYVVITKTVASPAAHREPVSGKRLLEFLRAFELLPECPKNDTLRPRQIGSRRRLVLAQSLLSGVVI